MAPDTETNQVASTSKKSKRSEPDPKTKRPAGFGFFDLDDQVPKKEPPSEQIQLVKKRGRPRKDASESPVK